MNNVHLATLLVATLVMLGCPPPPVNPQPDAADAQAKDSAPAPLTGDVYERACANLANLGCDDFAKGLDAGYKFDASVRPCADTLRLAAVTFDAGTTCLAVAKDKAGARSCGLKCP